MKLCEIKSPADIKGLNFDELRDLAEQMRQAILFRTSQIGGHVGPNLGVVESSLALNSVFNPPKDQIVLDVSHQDFPHKMLTGRVEGFIDKDHFKDVGEYTSPKESPEYDLFWAGHTSPSISLALGLVRARDLKKENYNVVAFIGDGSLSGGVALEALNQGAVVGSNFIVIVNDNQMAIAEDHGGFYQTLRELRETNGTSDNNLFKAMGWDYMYVAEGNNLEALFSAFKKVKDIDHPIVVHINTQKGEGYVPAEKNREEFHCLPPFVESTGHLQSDPSNPTYSSITGDYFEKKIKADPLFTVITAATPSLFCFHEDRRKAAGRQFVDVCIAEQTACGMAAGLAKGGATPVFSVDATFLQRAFDQLVEDISLDDLPVVLPIFGASIWGIKDATHLGFWDQVLISHIPNMVYLAPTNADEYLAMLEWATTQKKHPVAVRVPCTPVERAKEPVDTDYSEVKFKVTRQGSEVAIIAAGDFFGLGNEVADALEAKGIKPTVINPRFLTAIDEELLETLKKDHNLVVTLEDGSIDGGFGERIARFYGPSDTKVMCRGLAKKFVDRYDVDELLKEYRLTAPQITEDILSVVRPAK